MTPIPPQEIMMKHQQNQPILKATMSAVELAKALGVGKNAVYAAVRAGRIPNIGIGKTVRIPTNWFLALLDNWKVEDDSE
jgi:excisionase family DNA binding protein